MSDGYINAYHHSSRHAGEFSFNGGVHAHWINAVVAAQEEARIEPQTRRVGVWKIRLK